MQFFPALRILLAVRKSGARPANQGQEGKQQLSGIYIPANAVGGGRQGGTLRLVLMCVAAAVAGVALASWLAGREPHLDVAVTVASAAAFAVLVSMALLARRFVARGAPPAEGGEATPPHRLPDKWTEDLHEFTRRTLQMDLHQEPGRQLAELVYELFGLDAVVIFDADLGEVYQAGAWHDDPQEMAQNAYHFESSDDDPDTGFHRRVVRLGTVPIGSLIVRGEAVPLAVTFIASLVAVTFDRYRAAAHESRIEAERRAEQLRAAVLDGLAHAYKTPLTAIRAASTGLTEMGRLSAAQAELASLISEQAGQLSELTTQLLATARLEAGDVVVHATPVAVGPLIDEAVASLGERRGATPITVDLPDESLELCCDRRLMVMLLTQFLDNACKYSNAGSAITVRAVRTGPEVVFSVHSFGPVISMADRERIFDRFYRAATSAHRAAGTGIGLSVAKRAALIHGGSVWVASDETEGTTFYAAIPANRTEAGA